MRMRTAILATLVAVGWSAPSGVYASCGDYVTMRPHSDPSIEQTMPPPNPSESGVRGTVGISHLIQQPATGAGLAESAPAPAPCRQCPYQPAPGRGPCRGPWCSGNSSPLAAPPSAAPRSVEQADLFQLAALPAAHDLVLHAYLSGHADAIHHIVPIYHPPRSA